MGKLFKVGEYVEAFNIATNQNIPCGSIYQSDGLIVHVQNRHPNIKPYVSDIPAIISNPDFIGKHPKKQNSIELVKCVDKNIMVCIELDIKNDYLYVSSIYDISDGKLQGRIHSKRLKQYIDNS